MLTTILLFDSMYLTIFTYFIEVESCSICSSVTRLLYSTSRPPDPAANGKIFFFIKTE
jgi:hypothetical protein